MDFLVVKEFLATYALKFVVALLILGITRYLVKYVDRYLEKLLKKTEISPAVATLLSDLLKFVLWILGIAAALNVLGLQEIAIALGGSIAIIGLGLAKSISSVAGDLIAGIFLILDEDFDVGTKVKIGGVEGIVESLDVKKTKVRDLEGNLYVIPNKDVDGKIYVVKQDEKEEKNKE